MTSADPRSYWDGRYSAGGSSGPGSTGYRRWKWSVMEQHARFDDVIDVGCGDLSFWAERTPAKYTGIDFSDFVVGQNRQKWPHARFICAPAEQFQADLQGSAPVVMCLDVLFHVMDDSAYRKIIENLVAYSSEHVFVYTWTENPFLSWEFRLRYAVRLQLVRLLRSLSGSLADDGEYQRYRRFSDYVPMFKRAGFKLVALEQNPEPGSFGGLYVFRRGAA